MKHKYRGVEFRVEFLRRSNPLNNGWYYLWDSESAESPTSLAHQSPEDAAASAREFIDIHTEEE